MLTNYFFKVIVLLSFLCIFCLAMLYTAPTVGGQGLQMPFNATTWGASALFIFVSFMWTLKNHRLKVNSYVLAYLACLLTILAPLAVGNTEFVKYDILVIVGLVCSFIFFLSVVQIKALCSVNGLLLILLVSTVLQTLLGFVQHYFIFQPSPLFHRADVGIPYGTFFQKNVFCTYLSFGTLIALYFLTNLEKKNKFVSISLLLIVVLNAHVSMLTQAEIGRVVSLIALAMYLVLISFQKKKILLPLLIFIMCLLLSFTPKKWFDVRSSQEVTSSIGIESFGHRPVMYKLGVDLVLEKPLWGHGFGALHKQYSLIQGAYINSNPGHPQSEYMGHIHNEILQWIIQLGGISGLGFIGFLVIWIFGIKTAHLNSNTLLLALPFVGHSLLEYPFYHSAPHLIAFVTILALSIEKSDFHYKITPTVFGVTFVLSVVGVVKAIFFVFTTISSQQALIEYKHTIKETTIEPLTSITPTSTFKRSFEHEIFQWKLRKAVANGEIPSDLLLPFIEWAEAEIKYAPFKLIYIQLTQSYMLANDVENAKRVIAEAHHIFPTDEEVSGYYFKLHPNP